jgi:DNA-binding Lrp family transcriptional regulator
MTKTLDERDRKLLSLLQQNARQPLVALARALELSRSATQERLRRLERDGVIQAYRAVVRAEGRPPVQAWVSLTLGPDRSCADVVPTLRALPEVRLCHSLSGPVDILVLIEAASLGRLSEVRERIAALPAVTGATTAPVLADHKLG